MRKIGTVAAAAALAAVFLPPTPSQAFGVRLGPFYIGIPFFGHRHRHHYVPLRDDANLRSAEPTAGQASGQTSPLLYPAFALPVVFEQIFSPRSSAQWPFGYDAILQAAFAKPSAQTANACPQPGGRSTVAEMVRREVRPSGDQVQQLQKLDGALNMAAGYLAKACPGDVPDDPAARLQLMEWQVEKIAEALDIVRQPLADFQKSLNEAQLARLSAQASSASAAAHPARGDTVAPACAMSPTSVDATVEQISLSVQPTDAQKDAMNNLQQAFSSAANELDANCAAALPPDPLSRLEATESRLDATWRALVSIQTALSGLENGLNADQRARLQTVDFASVQ